MREKKEKENLTETLEWESLVLIEKEWMRKRKEMHRSPVAKTSLGSGGAVEYEGTIARKIWVSPVDKTSGGFLVAVVFGKNASIKMGRKATSGTWAMPEQKTITTSATCTESRVLYETSLQLSGSATASQPKWPKCKEQPTTNKHSFHR